MATRPGIPRGLTLTVPAFALALAVAHATGAAAAVGPLEKDPLSDASKARSQDAPLVGYVLRCIFDPPCTKGSVLEALGLHPIQF